MKLILAVLLSVCLVIFGVSYSYSVAESSYFENAQAVRALVIKNQAHTQDGYYKVTVRYQSPEGLITNDLRVSDRYLLKEGNQTTVYYNRNNPYEVKHQNAKDNLLFVSQTANVFGGMLLLLLLLFIVTVVQQNKNKVKEKAL